MNGNHLCKLYQTLLSGCPPSSSGCVATKVLFEVKQLVKLPQPPLPPVLYKQPPSALVTIPPQKIDGHGAAFRTTSRATSRYS